MPGVILSAALFTIIGACVAVFTLSTREVEEAQKKDEQADPRKVYYYPGSTRGGGGWRGKRRRLEQGIPGSFEMTEGEMNSWARSSFKKLQQPGGEEEEKKPFINYSISEINFRIDEGALQVAAFISLPMLKEEPIIYQTTGDFVSRNGVYTYKPRGGYFGQCPVPNVGNIPELIFYTLAAPYLQSEEYQKLSPYWRRLAYVEIAEDSIKAALP